MKTTLFSSVLGDVKCDLAFINKFDATTNPTVNDDYNDGYRVGSTWVNVSTGAVFTCVNQTVGAAEWTESSPATPGQLVAPAATTPTGNGSAALVQGGPGGTTSGAGGATNVTGGDATAGNSAGGSVVITGGAKQGTGIAGGIRLESLIIRKQGAPAAKTVSGLLTAADLLTGIITVNQAAGAASAQQLPTGTNIQAALPADFAVDDSFDVSIINTSTVDAEDASVTVNTDVTIVGNPDFPAHNALASAGSSGTLRIRKTADHVFVAYRIG